MTIFVAAGDETDDPNQRGSLFYGGFVCSFTDWTHWFAPAWQEHVLNGKRGAPTIPYLHMTDIRSRKWREEHGLTPAEADYRVDEACRVIRCSGFLTFCYSELDGGHFRNTLGTTNIIRPTKQPGTYRLAPDYMGVLGFAYAALEYVHAHHSDAHRLNFVVERKSGITHHVHDFLGNIGRC